MSCTRLLEHKFRTDGWLAGWLSGQLVEARVKHGDGRMAQKKSRPMVHVQSIKAANSKVFMIEVIISDCHVILGTLIVVLALNLTRINR